MLNPLDLNSLRRRFASAKPVPHVVIDDFLDDHAAEQILEDLPDFETALAQGVTFKTVNERKKIQITDATKFGPDVQQLNRLLASPKFVADLAFITDNPGLLADEQLVGGGIHITGPGGRLDVHVDFNYIEDRKLHRRLNLLLYLNKPWESDWGGQFQLWDKQVKRCEATFDPIFNRCVIFETNNISFHGVVPVSTYAQLPRRSFATYYYTREAPPQWEGVSHGTIFKARPEEKLKGSFLMPAEAIQNRLHAGIRHIKHSVKKFIGR
jgi:Rps23 Pro-64 3,4-dihydroxylase Tpa1-like proline 4-hydroxylase